MKEPQAVFTEYLNKNNLKMTPQRRIIVEVFLNERGHLASEDLYTIVKKTDKSIGQATVYRTLKLLSESGLAKEVNFGDGITRYERKYGFEHHDHIICDVCGSTFEFMNEQIEKLQEELAASKGFILTGHRMYLYGVCAVCQKKKTEQNR